MYKVFIVEDEYLIRDSLRHHILELSETFPITYIGEAGDGEMALSSILDLKPDIILTDIRMPFMDGLTFAKEARKIFPWVRIVFISGFDDFDYTKEAIQIQVDDYLLKPIKKHDLENSIQTIITQLNEQKNKIIKELDSHILLTEVRKNHLLNGIYKGKIPISTAFEDFSNFNKNISGKKFAVLLATNKFNRDFNDYTIFSEHLKQLFDNDEALLFSSTSSRFIKFLVFESNKDTLLEKCYQIAHTLIHEFEVSSEDDMTVAIGPVVNRFSEIPLSYEKTKELINTHSPFHAEKIINYEDDIKELDVSSDFPLKINLDQEINMLTSDNKEDLIIKLTKDHSNFERTRMMRFFTLTELNRLIEKKQFTKDSTFNVNSTFDNMLSVSTDKIKFEQTIRSMIDYLSNSDTNPSMIKYRSVMMHALTFIDQNYTSHDISLNRVAKELYLSPTHFSTIFSQSMKQTFIDYLTEKRIDLAKNKIIQTNNKVSDIAFDVGYNDPNYFSFLFKKKQGLSPKEYRKKFITTR